MISSTKVLCLQAHLSRLVVLSRGRPLCAAPTGRELCQRNTALGYIQCDYGRISLPYTVLYIIMESIFVFVWWSLSYNCSGLKPPLLSVSRAVA